MTDDEDGMVWQILHYQSGVEFTDEAWNAHKKVNEIFADAIAEAVSDGDSVWVHDYHLFLFPRYLRERLNKKGKRCPIGFTLHTPFPAKDFWRIFAVSRELLEGVVASDVVGFHTDEYKLNFVDSCVGLLGAEVTGEDIQYQDHNTHTRKFIVGVEPQKFADCLLDQHVQRRIEELEDIHKRKTVILGVDRLDMTKGLVQKFEGYDLFLKQHPELKGKVTLLQVVVPSRETVKEYAQLKRELDTLVGEIIGRHGTSSLM